MKKMLATVLVCIILILTVLFVSGVLGYGGKENQPPYEPGDPYPADGSTAVNINVDLSWTGGDPDPDDVVTYDVYFGTTSPPPQAISNQSDAFYDPGVLDFETTFYWQIIAWDDNGSFTEGPVWMFTTGKNQPPYQPTITCGPTAGGPRINLDFSAISPDPEGDQLYYMWDWDDGDFSDWLGPYTFGKTITTRYSWINDGEYEIKVKAKDTGEHESEWSEPYLVSISKQIEIDNLKPGFVYFNRDIEARLSLTKLIAALGSVTGKLSVYVRL